MGERCSVDVNECESSPCSHGICFDSTIALNSTLPTELDVAVCSTASRQGCAMVGMRMCGSSCVPILLDVAINAYSCHCEAGWDGANCAADVDECVSLPCVDGICVDSSTCKDSFPASDCSALDFVQCGTECCSPSIPIDTYACTCERGATGHNCDTDIDECVSSPCDNGGQCLHSSSG
eukprot:COSAG05_NODE_10020_length_587_cov_4.391393_1_plen_178_part_01